MILNKKVGFVFSLLVLSIGAKASSPAKSNGEFRFGVIDLRQVVTSVDEGLQAQKTLQAEVDKIKTQIKKQEEDFIAQQEKFTKQAALMKDSAKQQQQKQLQDSYIALEQSKMRAQTDLQQKEQEAFQTISVKASKLVGLVADEDKLTLVFDKTSGIVYVKPDMLVDITEKVITMYNNMTSKATVAAKDKLKTPVKQ
jgi:outer membrane protein